MVGEVLAHYVDFKASLPKAEGLKGAGSATLAAAIAALAPFWGDLTCDAVKASVCRAYERERAIPREVTTTTRTGKTLVRSHAAGSATVRRELGVLQAALNHAHGEGLLVHPLKVTLPATGVSRERWLTRSEAAALLRAASPHIRRFILIALYTGRRATAVLDLTWHRVDLNQCVIRFRAEGEAETNKRRGRVRIPRQLAAHLKRWQKRSGGTHVVMFRGKRLDSVKRGIARAAERAGLTGVTPHVLKHSAITWAVMNGLGVEDAAEYFDTSPDTIRKHYWHHSPLHQQRALDIMERRR